MPGFSFWIVVDAILALSMADVTGLVIGAIALASLFTTCIDLFDRFELGRNYAYDYQLACTKMCLLKARLSAWGDSLNIEAPGREHPNLRRCWTEEQGIIGRSLFGIKEIFGNAALLSQRYKLTASRQSALRSVITYRPKERRIESENIPPVRLSASSWTLLRKRTVWAIHDKQKFDVLINDLSFLIDNLEKVIERFAMSRPVKVAGDDGSPSTNSSTKQPQITPVVEHLPSASDVKVNPGHTLLRARGIQLPGQDALDPLRLKELAAGMNGSVIYSNQEVDGVSAGTAGNIGYTGPGPRHVIVATQTVRGHSVGSLGDMEGGFALALQKQMFEQNLALQQAPQLLAQMRHDAAGVHSQDSKFQESPAEAQGK